MNGQNHLLQVKFENTLCTKYSLCISASARRLKIKEHFEFTAIPFGKIQIHFFFHCTGIFFHLYTHAQTGPIDMHRHYGDAFIVKSCKSDVTAT